MNQDNYILKAGAIIRKKINNKNHYLLLYRGKQQDYSFPKGHIEDDESIKSAVLREIKEETGLDINFLKELTPQEFINSRNGEKTKMYMFLAEPVTETLILENEQDELIWATKEEVIKLVPNLLSRYFISILPELK